MAGNDSRAAAAEKAFRARMSALGATVTGNYLNNKTPVLAVCAKGHRCAPTPWSIQAGRGPCQTCGGRGRPSAALRG